ELLDGDLGVGAARVLHVALDQRDLVRLYLVGVELQIELHAAVDQLGELGADTGVRQVDADLHLLRVRQGGGHGERSDSDGDDSLHHVESPSPEGSNRESESQTAGANTRAKAGKRASYGARGSHRPRRVQPSILCDNAAAERRVSETQGGRAWPSSRSSHRVARTILFRARVT